MFPFGLHTSDPSTDPLRPRRAAMSSRHAFSSALAVAVLKGVLVGSTAEGNTAKKASRHLLPGDFVAVIGVGGLGHIGVQVLKALCAAEIIAVDRSDTALNLA